MTAVDTVVAMKEEIQYEIQHSVSDCTVRTRAGQSTQPPPCFTHTAPRGNITGSTLSSSKHIGGCGDDWSSLPEALGFSSPDSKQPESPQPPQQLARPQAMELLCLKRGFLLQGDKEDSRSSGWFDFARGIDHVKPAGLLGCGSILHVLPAARTRKEPSPAHFQPLKCHLKGQAEIGMAELC